MSTRHLAASRTTAQEASTWYELIDLSSLAEVNLGHGFPGFPPADFIIQALLDSVNDVNGHQYTRVLGHPRLVKALAAMYSKLLDRHIDPMKEIVVTPGAFNGLYCAILGVVNPGDEVIVFEPFYEAYKIYIKMAGATPVYVPLRPVKTGKNASSSDWVLDMEELKSKVTEKTKCMIINNPLNPLGKVFSRSELECLAKIAVENDILVISDEVYEFLVYGEEKHIRTASLADMWCRTLTVGSAGKAFGVTGWRVGWVYGPAKLMSGPQRMFSDVSRCCPTPNQEAVARLLEQQAPLLGTEKCYWNELTKFLEEKRDDLIETLTSIGLNPFVPQGGYFLIVDYEALKKQAELPENGDCEDLNFVRWMTTNKKLHSMPLTVFYGEEHMRLGEKYIRLCFTKDSATLKRAREILTELRTSEH